MVGRHTGTAGTLALTALLALVACGSGSSGAGADAGTLRIVTTVAPITSIVSNVVGDRAEVRGIIPEGIDSHTFEPGPSVAEDLSEADVVYLNGPGLEDPTRELAEDHVPDPGAVIELGRRAIPAREQIFDFSFPRSGGRPNPHLWTDPTLALRYAEIVRDDASERDPGNARRYAANYDALAEVVAELDHAMREAFATVPVRKLLTYHDAYAYFARTYGWEVVGAIQVSDFEDPSPRQVADLIDQVRREHVPAIFGSEVFPSPVLEQIGREAGVTYVDELRDDDLPGAPGEEGHSWLGLVRLDVVTMTEALGGDASALRALDLRIAAPDRAAYAR